MEKTPSHALCISEIKRLLPQSRIIHILRDPRDVVTSLLAVSRSWGAAWAPKRATAAAALWADHVTARQKRRSGPSRTRVSRGEIRAAVRDPRGNANSSIVNFSNSTGTPMMSAERLRRTGHTADPPRGSLCTAKWHSASAPSFGNPKDSCERPLQAAGELNCLCYRKWQSGGSAAGLCATSATARPSSLNREERGRETS